MAERKKILIVEDDADIRVYLTTLLEDNGYATVTADDGKEGLIKARTERPDLVLLDLMMPEQSGTDFYRNLTKDKTLSDTPVIVVSGTAGSHLAVKNAAAVLPKPIDQAKLIETLAQLLPTVG